MADLTHGFSVILDAAGVERLVWPASGNFPDLTEERARQRREAAIAKARAVFGYELDEDGVVALKRCVHTGASGMRCAKQCSKYTSRTFSLKQVAS